MLIRSLIHRSIIRLGVQKCHTKAVSESVVSIPLPPNIHVHNTCIWNPSDLAAIVNSDCLLIPDFVTSEEESALVKDVEPRFKRLRYEESHWDDAIVKYRETEKRNWCSSSDDVIERIRHVAFASGVTHLSNVHVLDLHEDGYIKPHIDSVRFCGSTIAGVSLLSQSIMRLTHHENKQLVIDMFLPRRSLYILRGIGRHDFKHEILASGQLFADKPIKKTRRISVICRSSPDPQKLPHS